jgi:hypothetical protein
MGARHRLGIGLSYRPARLHRLAELMPWHRFLGSIKVSKYQLWSRIQKCSQCLTLIPGLVRGGGEQGCKMHILCTYMQYAMVLLMEKYCNTNSGKTLVYKQPQW